MFRSNSLFLRNTFANNNNLFLRSTASLLCAAKTGSSTRELIQFLRARTDAPILDCKKALTECGTEDIEKCVEWLKKKGVASADKKVSRETTQGVVTAVIARDASTGKGLGACCFKLCAETDFAARNEKFLQLASELSNEAEKLIQQNTWEPLHNASNFGTAFEGKIKDYIAQIGENLAVRQLVPLPCNDGLPNIIGSYAHAASSHSPNSGSIVALSFLSTKNASTDVKSEDYVQVNELANDIAQTCVANYFNTDCPLEETEVVGYPSSYGEEESMTIKNVTKKESLELCRLFMMSTNDVDVRDFTYPGFPKP